MFSLLLFFLIIIIFCCCCFCFFFSFINTFFSLYLKYWITYLYMWILSASFSFNFPLSIDRRLFENLCLFGSLASIVDDDDDEIRDWRLPQLILKPSLLEFFCYCCCCFMLLYSIRLTVIPKKFSTFILESNKPHTTTTSLHFELKESITKKPLESRLVSEHIYKKYLHTNI